MKRYCETLPQGSGGENARNACSHQKNFLGDFRFWGVIFMPFFREVIGLATARKGKIEESPGFCKAEDLANLFALTGQWINQLTRDGVLKKRDTPAGKRYNVVESTRAYEIGRAHV